MMRDRFSSDFLAAFVEPTASHRWGSRRAKLHWCDLETLRDKLAGPLSDSRGSGYVYKRNDQFFSGVSDPESLRTRLLQWLDDLSAEVSRFETRTSRQRADFAYMKSLVDKMRELIEALIESERIRFKASS